MYIFSLPMSMAATYIRKYFNQESKDEAILLAKNIQNEFIEMLEKSSWMDEHTREKAIEKANTMTLNIGYPDEMTDDHRVEEYFRELELQPNSLLQSVLRVRQFQKNQKIHELRSSIVKNDWRDIALRAADVDAFYHPMMNSISKFSKRFLKSLYTFLASQKFLVALYSVITFIFCSDL